MYYGIVGSQHEQLLHVFPPPLSVLALIEPNHHAIINRDWDDFELEYETVDARTVEQVMCTDQEIQHLNEQLHEQACGSWENCESFLCKSGSVASPAPVPKDIASTHICSTKENTITNVATLATPPKKPKAKRPQKSMSKQTVLGAFPNFAKHAEKLSEMKPKKGGTSTPKKQTTLDSFIQLSSRKAVVIDPADVERESYECNGIATLQEQLKEKDALEEGICPNSHREGAPVEQ
jgi:hypothetical protein